MPHLQRLWNLGALLALLSALHAGAGVAATPEQPEPTNRRLTSPQSRLHEPFAEPIFLTGHLAFGGASPFGHGYAGYGASLIFRPGSSANFFNFLYDWRSAMVLRLDYQKLDRQAGRAFSGDLILRRYLSDRGDHRAEVLPFAGLGFGATDVQVPPSDGGGNSRYWSWLVEVGQEWYFLHDYVLVARLQYRHFGYGGISMDAWAVSGAIGIPVPW
ncbi:hypothetical protein KDM41_10315 [bacterium]|nr:hypothetical protein [bacterium]